jgi:hypothetical protein
MQSSSDGIQEVSGSIPLISTKKSSENFGFRNFFVLVIKGLISLIGCRGQNFLAQA